MSLGGFEQNNTQPLSEINVTPLVDVILVLLIIFMITAPLMTQAIKVDLPAAEGAPTQEQPEIIRLQINAEGGLSWNGETLDDTGLKKQLGNAAHKNPQPELQVLADRAVRYEHVGKVMAQVRNAGISKMGFVMMAGAQGE